MDTLTLLQKHFPGKAFLTLGETAHYLRMCRTTLWVARKNGNAPRTIRVGKIQRVYLRDLAEFIDSPPDNTFRADASKCGCPGE